MDAAAADNAGRLVALADGRELNLRCSGRGSPTVILEAGFGAGAGAWHKVQPALSRTTRVCAYDRAGTGYSDPGPLPRDGAAIARDLDEALTAAKIDGPYIVVGHSAGGLYARLFAARRLGDVAGLLLLDPTVERRAPRPQGDGLDGLRQRAGRCLAAAEASPTPAANDPRWAGCLPARPNAHDLEIATRPDTWKGQLSELDSLFGRTSDQVFRAGPVLRAIPIYVITAAETAAASPIYSVEDPRSVWELQHQQIARGSELGSQRTVYASHMIMLDRPDAVIAPVEELIRAQRAHEPPSTLPPSETEQPLLEQVFKAPDESHFDFDLSDFNPFRSPARPEVTPEPR